MARTEWDRAIGHVASSQHGVISHPQLRAIGISASTIWDRVRHGRLIALYRGVYAVAYLPVGSHGHWTAAVIACGPDAWLSHASAGALLGVRQTSAARIDVTVLNRSGRGRDGIRVHSAGTLDASQVTVVAGIPCTTVARTIFDLAGILRLGALEHAIQQAQTKRIFDRDALSALVRAHPTRAGTAAIRTILGLSLPGEDELNRQLARRFLRLCVRARLPAPLAERWIALPDGGGYEVDFCWPAHRLIVETDGRAYHANERGFENDRLRDRRLTLAGWRVVRFTWRDVTERPDDVVAELGGLLSAAVVAG